MIRPADRPVDERGGMDWLGPEFLTWLAWRSVTDPHFSSPDGTEIWLHLDEHLELRGERAAARRTTLRAGSPAASAEAKVALRHGKVVTAARWILARGEEETTFTLRAEDLDVSSCRLPTPDGDDAEDRLAHSLAAARRVWQGIDVCYAAFLDVRCSSRWDSEVARVRAWVESPSDEERAALSPPS